MRTGWLVAALAICACVAWTFGRPEDIPFEKHTLDLGANETCALADINGDGRLDVVAGENWYESPKWTKHHFRDFPFWNNYIDLPLDVNGDGRMDLVSASWNSKKLAWWENPGGRGQWKEHPIETGFN